MAAEVLDFQGTYYKQPAGTDGINDWEEVNRECEVFRVTSNETGDWLFSRRFHKINAVLIQNHGATFATGTRDVPKIAITQGTTTANAKITITHTSTREVFSIFVWGE